MVPSKVKTALFYFLILLPSLLVAAIAFNITYNILRINRGLDYKGMTADISLYLASDRSSVSASVDRGVMTLKCEYTDPRSEYKGFVREVPFAPSGDDRIVYVYGSSPVISKPPFFAGKFRTFSDILEDRLNARGDGHIYKVFNFGITSADSASINKIVEATVKARNPDLIVYYYAGDMDYQAAYLIAGVKKQHYLLTIVPIEAISRALSLKRSGWLDIPGKYARWFNRTYLQPYLLNFFQAAGLVKIDFEPFAAMNSKIEADIEKNITALTEFAGKERVPLVVVTNAMNLEAKPFGAYRITEKYYRDGMREKDFIKKAGHLSGAVDSETFSGDLRPKTQTYKALLDIMNRGLDGVYVFDLMEEMMREGRGFDYSYFYDYGHLKPAMHREIADKLYVFLEGKGLI